MINIKGNGIRMVLNLLLVFLNRFGSSNSQQNVRGHPHPPIDVHPF